MAESLTTTEKAAAEVIDKMAGEVFQALKDLQEIRGDVDSLYLAAGTLKGVVAYLCDDRQQFERLAEALQHWLGYVEDARKLRDTPPASGVAS